MHAYLYLFTILASQGSSKFLFHFVSCFYSFILYIHVCMFDKCWCCQEGYVESRSEHEREWGWASYTIILNLILNFNWVNILHLNSFLDRIPNKPIISKPNEDRHVIDQKYKSNKMMRSWYKIDYVLILSLIN